MSASISFPSQITVAGYDFKAIPEIFGVGQAEESNIVINIFQTISLPRAGNSLNGRVSINFPSGERFVGKLRNGVANGHGIVTKSSAERFEGQFSDGFLIGTVQYINKKGVESTIEINGKKSKSKSHEEASARKAVKKDEGDIADSKEISDESDDESRTTVNPQTPAASSSAASSSAKPLSLRRTTAAAASSLTASSAAPAATYFAPAFNSQRLVHTVLKYPGEDLNVKGKRNRPKLKPY